MDDPAGAKPVPDRGGARTAAPRAQGGTRVSAEGSLMAGKRGLVMGVANDHSIAWGIAQALAAQGAEIAFTYQGEAFGRRVAPLAESLGGKLLISCDAELDDELDQAFERIGETWPRIDFVVHSIAYSDRG